MSYIAGIENRSGVLIVKNPAGVTTSTSTRVQYTPNGFTKLYMPLVDNIADISPQVLPTVANGPTVAEGMGRHGENCYYFDGSTGNNIIYTTSCPVSLQSGWTMSIWFKTLGETTHRIASLGYSNQATDTKGKGGLLMRVDSGHNYGPIYNGIGWGYWGQSGGITEGVWRNHVITTDGSTINFYWNGGSKSTANQLLNLTEYCASIGASFSPDTDWPDATTWGGERFYGYANDFLIEDRIWSDAEVLAYYNQFK